MKKMTKAAMATVSLAASLTMLVAGCGGTTNSNNTTNTTQADQPVDGGSITIGQASKYDTTFIPEIFNDLYTQWIDSFAYDPLLTINNKLEFVPDLAKSYTWSDDKKTLTISLDNANWSDGQPITSDDVLYTLDYLNSKTYVNDLQGQDQYLVQSIHGNQEAYDKGKSFADVGGFKKIDDKTFELMFDAPDAAVLYSQIAGIVPIPKHSLENTPMKDWLNSDFDKKPTVTSGPYTFSQVNGTDSVEFAANPNYFRGKPHIDKVTFKTITADVAPGLLANGSLDMQLNGLKPTDVSKLQAIPNVKVQLEAGLSYQYLGLKTTKKEFQDVKVRQAFMYGVNRQAIVDGLLKGEGNTLNTPLPDASWAAAKPSDGLNEYKYDPDKANQLLDEAGWKIGSDGWRIDPVTGKTAVLPLDYPQGNTVRIASATSIEQDFQKLHIKVDKHPPTDFQAYYKKVQNDDPSIWMFLGGWFLGVDPDPRGLYMSTDASNYPRWKDSHADDLAKATWGVQAFDKNYRKQALVQWQLYLNQQLPYVFLYQQDDVYAYSTKLHIPASDWSVQGPLNYQDWWVK